MTCVAWLASDSRRRKALRPTCTRTAQHLALTGSGIGERPLCAQHLQEHMLAGSLIRSRPIVAS